jgi:hypothetical protein
MPFGPERLGTIVLILPVEAFQSRIEFARKSVEERHPEKSQAP